MAIVTIAVEGSIDEVVARRLLEKTGHSAGPVYGRTGKGEIDRAIRGYNKAAKFLPWFVLRDLDTDGCVRQLVATLLPDRERKMVFRVAVHEVEAWLLADRAAFAKYFGVSETRVPENPDTIADPKQAIVNIAPSSRFRTIREGMVPRSNRGVGPGYDDILIEFVQTEWNILRAQRASDSLARCVRALESLS